MLGWHNQNSEGDDTPMPAVESPWLIINGTRDGGATPETTATTVDRLNDRPVYSVGVEGANHFQLTDYVDVQADLLLPNDPEPTVGNREARAAAAEYVVAFARLHLLDDDSIADDLGAGSDDRVTLDLRPARIQAPTDHGLPRVMSEPRFEEALEVLSGSDVIATEVFEGVRYFLVRNDELGVEVWREGGLNGLESIRLDGVDFGFYGNKFLNGMLGDLAVFNGELYAAVSSGSQGAKLSSTGGEIWAFNGQSWRPVVSGRVDFDPDMEIVTCVPGAIGELRIAGSALEPGVWAGGTVDNAEVTIDADEPRALYIVDNTADIVFVEANDVAGEPDDVDCDGMSPGTRVSLRQGADEAGFGQPWNKAIVDLEVFEGKLYAGTGLNYENGAELWVTEDGSTFEIAVPRAAFGEHAGGLPITSSISGMHVSDVTGEPVLYIGGTGTDGYGARLMAYRADGSYEFLVDEPGYPASQIPSMVTWNGRLWMSAMSFDGMQLMSMTPDGELHQHIEPGWGDSSQLTARLFVFDDQLWAADVAFIQSRGELSDKSAYVWRTADGESWQLVTAHAFGVNAIKVSQLFETSIGLHAIASSAALSTKRSYGPLRIYLLEQRSE
jgi:hypothetical protein